jgi:hypothetical protein
MIKHDVEIELAEANSMIKHLIREIHWARATFGTISLTNSDEPRDVTDMLRCAETGYNKMKLVLDGATKLTHTIDDSRDARDDNAARRMSAVAFRMYAEGSNIDIEPIIKVIELGYVPNNVAKFPAAEWPFNAPTEVIYSNDKEA